MMDRDRGADPPRPCAPTRRGRRESAATPGGRGLRRAGHRERSAQRTPQRTALKPNKCHIMTSKHLITYQ